MPVTFEEEEEPGFWQRHRVAIVIGVVILLAGAAYALKGMLAKSPSSSRPEAMTMVMLPPPPPPPPPKPTPPPPPENQPPPEQTQQKMEMQQPVQDEKKQEAPKEKAPDAPAPLGTSITGPGGVDMGLASGLGGGGGYGRGGGGGGSKYGWYASQVQNRIAEALRNNPRTRKASLAITVRIWPDSSGRISRARLAGSTGDPALDAALQNDVLTGLQLTDPPPAEMPLPIVLRLSARRPH